MVSLGSRLGVEGAGGIGVPLDPIQSQGRCSLVPIDLYPPLSCIHSNARTNPAVIDGSGRLLSQAWLLWASSGVLMDTVTSPSGPLFSLLCNLGIAMASAVLVVVVFSPWACSQLIAAIFSPGWCPTSATVAISVVGLSM